MDNKMDNKYSIKEHSKKIVEQHFKDNYYKKKSTSLEQLTKDLNNEMNKEMMMTREISSINSFFYNQRYINQKTKKNSFHRFLMNKKKRTKKL